MSAVTRITPSLSATITFWDEGRPRSPGPPTTKARRNPSAKSKRCHWSRPTRGDPASRFSSSSNRHQPSRSPKVSVANSCYRVTSFKTSHPFSFSRAFAFLSVRGILLVAWRTFVASARSNRPPAPPHRRASFSMSRTLNSTNG
ncbi:hypothetical protein WMF34_21270 [Sorangium sp. So ce145]